MTCKDCIHYEACVSFWFSDYEICNSYDECKKKHENDKTCVFFKSSKDVVEVRHGYWVHNEDHSAYESEYFCSVCLADGASDIRGEHYCYNCGAKMDGERKADNG